MVYQVNCIELFFPNFVLVEGSILGMALFFPPIFLIFSHSAISQFSLCTMFYCIPYIGHSQWYLFPKNKAYVGITYHIWKGGRVSQDNGSWLDLAWVVLGLSSRRAVRYHSRSLERCLATLALWLCSLDQTTLHCSFWVWFWDKYLGYDKLQWGAIVASIESESWSYSKGTQLRGIGRSEQDVVGLQEIEPKVRFLILQGLYTYMRQL